MSKLPVVARIFLGLVFFVFGLNGFFMFLPMPPMPEAAGALMGAMAASGYMFPLIKATEVIAGAMLLANRYVALALLLLAPIIVNIFLFHAALAPDGGKGMVMPVLLVAAAAFLGWSYRNVYGHVLAAKVQPVGK